MFITACDWQFALATYGLIVRHGRISDVEFPREMLDLALIWGDCEAESVEVGGVLGMNCDLETRTK